jgi:protein-tyrosine phosphatase
MIDWHCHLLPAIDDGSASSQESVSMARLLSLSGYTQVYCTPHLIKGSYEADNATVSNAVVSLMEKLQRESINLQLLPGREYYLDEFLFDHPAELLPLGDSRFILIEIPGHTPVELAKSSCYRLTCSGYTPLIAHPERCRLLEPEPDRTENKWSWRELFNQQHKTQNTKPVDKSSGESVSLLRYLQDIGCQFQGNLGSFSGYYGERVRFNAEKMRTMNLYNCFGTDGHSLKGLQAVLPDDALRLK